MKVILIMHIKIVRHRIIKIQLRAMELHAQTRVRTRHRIATKLRMEQRMGQIMDRLLALVQTVKSHHTFTITPPSMTTTTFVLTPMHLVSSTSTLVQLHATKSVSQSQPPSRNPAYSCVQVSAWLALEL